MLQEQINYKRIAQAIDYIQEHFKDQPSLNEMARAIGVSPYHFQRLFSEWAGVSPKKFMQYLTLGYAKDLLKKESQTLLDTAFTTGLSGTSRLHDLFVTIEGMTPGDYKNGGQHLTIQYGFSESPFGKMMVASTTRGVCHMSFEEDEARALSELIRRFPNAQLRSSIDAFQENAMRIFQKDWKQLDQIKLYLKGTAFQLKVWEALLKIPMGTLTTYGAIARKLDCPRAARAVGSAVGSNPIAMLIPCHRVIQASGKVSGYMWGTTRKSAMIGWEASRTGS